MKELRVIGNEEPELEVTLTPEGRTALQLLINELRVLRGEIAQLRQEVNAIDTNSRQNQDWLKILARWDTEGMPATR